MAARRSDFDTVAKHGGVECAWLRSHASVKKIGATLKAQLCLKICNRITYMPHPNSKPSLVEPFPISPGPNHLDELPRRILRSWMVWKAALDANYAAEELDGTAPSGSGLIMFALFERDGWTIGELAQRARVTHVAVVHLIQRLEDARLVKRKQCPKDGRATRVWLTQRGRDLEPRMRALHERNIATLVRVLGIEDATQLGELLDRLIEGLAEDSESMPQAASKAPKAARIKC